VSDVVVTVPKGMWEDWIAEGALPGWKWVEGAFHFWIPQSPLPNIKPGERVYVVAHGKLRGYAPLVELEKNCMIRPGRACLMREGGAVAVTIPEYIRGFQGWRYRWWERDQETPFPGWRRVGVPQ
jgi:hypothetical protein